MVTGAGAGIGAGLARAEARRREVELFDELADCTQAAILAIRLGLAPEE